MASEVIANSTNKDSSLVRKVFLLTYKPQEFRDIALDEDELKRRCPLDNGRHDDDDTVSCLNPISSLKHLDSLPMELWTTVLLGLDLQSLTVFRSVNQRARSLVDNLPFYKDIIQHAPNIIRAALSLKLARWLHCRPLYRALCSQACVLCGDFGAFIYLLTCSRACTSCLQGKRQFRMRSLSNAEAIYGLSEEALSLLPTCLSTRSLCSRYTGIWPTRVTFVDEESARRAGIMLHGSADMMDEYVLSKSAERQILHAQEQIKRRLAGQQGARQILANPNPVVPKYPVLTRVNLYGIRDYDAIILAGSIRAPYLDQENGTVEWGLSCVACRNQHPWQRGKMHDKRKLYSPDQYLDHLEECERSQEAWRLYVDRHENTTEGKVGSYVEYLR